MRRTLPALALALAAVPAAAAGDDPLKSAQCEQALAALDAHEAATSKRLDAEQRRERQTLQRRAAHACLRDRLDPPLPAQRMAQPPLAVRIVPVPAPKVSPPSPAPAPPVARPAAPAVVTSCDTTGCWTSEGKRLQRVGPNLVGPGGVCSAPAGVLSCP